MAIWAPAYGGEKVADKDDQFTPIGLENGVVVGWGWNFSNDIMKTAERQPTAKPSLWYYCAAASAYYPSVQTCPEAWLLVPSQPK